MTNTCIFSGEQPPTDASNIPYPFQKGDPSYHYNYQDRHDGQEYYQSTEILYIIH